MIVVYLVIRETKWKIPRSYGDYGDYWDTETDVVSAHRTLEDAERMIETKTALNIVEDTRYYWDAVELEED
jgi:hypothetical protein